MIEYINVIKFSRLYNIFFSFSYDIEITDEIVGRAPIPELIVGVKQDGMYLICHSDESPSLIFCSFFPYPRRFDRRGIDGKARNPTQYGNIFG